MIEKDVEKLIEQLRNTAALATRERRQLLKEGHRFTADVLHDCAFVIEQAIEALDKQLGTIDFRRQHENGNETSL